MDQMDVIKISKFKATCLSVLDTVKRTGKPVLVTRHDRPIAIIAPPPPPQKKASWLGTYKSKGRILRDIISPAVEESEWEVLSE